VANQVAYFGRLHGLGKEEASAAAGRLLERLGVVVAVVVVVPAGVVVVVAPSVVVVDTPVVVVASTEVVVVGSPGSAGAVVGAASTAPARIGPGVGVPPAAATDSLATAVVVRSTAVCSERGSSALTTVPSVSPAMISPTIRASPVATAPATTRAAISAVPAMRGLPTMPP
ncbi:MAG TPA: hypothetical protein VHM94_13400, partial [Acidimicrobiia bacterium]|nr:hypothetical protein [Acidimicrobiia bacterium]